MWWYTKKKHVCSSAGGNWSQLCSSSSRKYQCVHVFALLPGFTGIPSTSLPAERSDSPSTQDTLARGVFQVPQWLVSVSSVFFFPLLHLFIRASARCLIAHEISSSHQVCLNRGQTVWDSGKLARVHNYLLCKLHVSYYVVTTVETRGSCFSQERKRAAPLPP